FFFACEFFGVGGIGRRCGFRCGFGGTEFRSALTAAPTASPAATTAPLLRGRFDRCSVLLGCGRDGGRRCGRRDRRCGRRAHHCPAASASTAPSERLGARPGTLARVALTKRLVPGYSADLREKGSGKKGLLLIS
ncbi:MAG: hypothetical protein ACOY5V_05440, partial [Pseudomonadota bacterium]